MYGDPQASAAAENTADAPGSMVASGPPTSETGTRLAEAARATWTDGLPESECTTLFRSTDFAATNLGPLSQWGPALRLYTSLVFADNRGASLYWGSDLITIYNDKFAESAANTHPALMGSPFYQTFPELRARYTKIFEQTAAHGKATEFEKSRLILHRNGYPEETFFTLQHIPVRGDGDTVVGFYNTIVETTAAVLQERRRRVLDAIAAAPPVPLNETLAMFAEALRLNPDDVGAAMIYSFDDAIRDAANLHLRGSIGVPEGHRIAPLEAHLETSQDGLIPFFRQIEHTGKPLVLREDDGSIPNWEEFLDGFVWGENGVPAREMVICSLAVGGSIIGYYVQTISPHKHYDHATEMGLVDLTRLMESKWLASSSEQAMERRQQLLEEQASESEKKLRHMAQSAPVGMVQVDHINNKISWANEQFFAISGHDPSKPDLADYSMCLAPEERETNDMNVRGLVYGRRIYTEIRLMRTWTPPAEGGVLPEPTSAWMLATAFPMVENGEVKYLMAYVTDISQLKWAASIQERNAAAATLAKKRQEDLIDTVTHELRNPLSAITQLADGIEKNMQVRRGDATEDTWRSIAEDNALAASTILACAGHMKSVTEDVLTMSRLSSDMLSITPVVTETGKVINTAMRMFDGEARVNEIEVVVARDNSADGLWAEHTLLDPSRLTQILLNYLSNAVKFLAPEPVRKISLTYGAQGNRPEGLSTKFGPLSWVTPVSSHRTNTSLPALQDGGESLYLWFIVQDTGPGISAEGINNLFKRFSQASARTHVSYGGTGLGLYICRELAEKQGGSVGVVSQQGQGSAFGFYVETQAATSREHLPVPATDPMRGIETTPSPLAELLPHSSAAPKHLRPSSTTTSLPQKTSTQPSPLSPSSSAPTHIHVLLVEDNLVNQKILSKQLRTNNCTVTVANHGIEALEVLETSDCWRRQQPDTTTNGGPLPVEIVLMDVEMPRMNGMECARRIRELEAEGVITRHLPILAVTANVRQAQQDLAIAAGMDGVLSKPFVVAEALARMRELLRTRNGNALAPEVHATSGV